MSKIREIIDKYKVEIDADNYGGSALTVISDDVADSEKTYEGLAFDELEKELQEYVDMEKQTTREVANSIRIL